MTGGTGGAGRAGGGGLAAASSSKILFLAASRASWAAMASSRLCSASSFFFSASSSATFFLLAYENPSQRAKEDLKEITYDGDLVIRVEVHRVVVQILGLGDGLVDTPLPIVHLLAGGLEGTEVVRLGTGEDNGGDLLLERTTLSLDGETAVAVQGRDDLYTQKQTQSNRSERGLVEDHSERKILTICSKSLLVSR